jgi:hypothetical protein
MDELKWELLTEVQGRLEAEFIKSYFEASGIEIELFQESVGHHLPVTVDGLGRVSCLWQDKHSSHKLAMNIRTPRRENHKSPISHAQSPANTEPRCYHSQPCRLASLAILLLTIACQPRKHSGTSIDVRHSATHSNI